MKVELSNYQDKQSILVSYFRLERKVNNPAGTATRYVGRVNPYLLLSVTYFLTVAFILGALFDSKIIYVLFFFHSSSLDCQLFSFGRSLMAGYVSYFNVQFGVTTRIKCFTVNKSRENLRIGHDS